MAIRKITLIETGLSLLVLDVEQNLLFLSVVLYETVQSVRVRHPPDQAGVRRQGDHGKTLNRLDQENYQRCEERFL